MSDNKPPKTLWVGPVKPTTDDTPATWPIGDQATLAYTQRKARCIPYIEPAQFMEEVERRSKIICNASRQGNWVCDSMINHHLYVSDAMQELCKEIMEGKV